VGRAAGITPGIERDLGMAVRIRLTRVGKKNRPFFRLAVFDSKTRRDGRYLENLGLFDPLIQDEKKKLTINVVRLHHWTGHGALPTPKVEKLLLHCGIPVKAEVKAAPAPAAKPAAKPARK
jgi:small subunit ribosomal protein S16